MVLARYFSDTQLTGQFLIEQIDGPFHCEFNNSELIAIDVETNSA